MPREATQFKKGQVANPKGRPKAQTITVSKLQAAVSARALDMLEGGLGKAWNVLDEHLDNGNAQVAMWLIERLTGGARSMLPQAIDIKLSTMDDVMHAAQAVTEMCLQRKLSVDDATKSLQMLSQYASFRAFERIDELKDMIEEMNRANEAKTVNGSATMPSWGRLSEDTKTANMKPAE